MVATCHSLPLRYTRHAVTRCQQRGLSSMAVGFIVTYGHEYHAGNGATAYFLGQKAVVAARGRHGVKLDRWQGTAVIVSGDQSIVTVQHVSRPKRSWRGRD